MILEKDADIVELIDDRLKGMAVTYKVTTIDNLQGIFADEEARIQMHTGTIVYKVDAYLPVAPGTLGGLFFGVTHIQPGQVGKEYFMTRGHFHALSDRSEFYWGIKGEGVLILMDRNRKIRTEMVRSGSLHYIPADTAHRVANSGNDILSFGACWPADAGYDYEEIERNGFSARLFNENGNPVLRAGN